MGLFDEKKEYSRQELRKKLKRDPGAIPGTGGRKYTQRERINLEKEIFGPKYGGRISEKDYNQALRKVEKEAGFKKGGLGRLKGEERKEGYREAYKLENRAGYLKRLKEK